MAVDFEIICCMNFTWTNPNYPEGAVRVELHISGSEGTCLHGLIEEIAEPFDVSSHLDDTVVIYTSTKKTQEVLHTLYEVLKVRHPNIVGRKDGIYFNNGVVYFEDCEVWVKPD